ncbi:MAG: hypothetical protein GX174_06890 [Lentisphaerae bacterium]|jgi:tetratricopeptide (TPR) repeat protein|nr:hypothetical protein [Lentisphaerota bacterium]
MTTKNALYIVKPFCLGLLSLLLLAGCGKRKPAPSEAEPAPAGRAEEAAAELQPVEDPVSRILRQADEALMNGATNEALATLQAAMDDPALADNRQPLFNGLIRFLLFTGQVEDARARMLDAYRNDASLAVSGLGLVYGYLMEQGDLAEVVTWTETVLAIPELPAEVRRSMREWNLLAHVSLHNDDKMLEIVAQLIHDAPGGNAIALLTRAIDALFDQKRPQAVGKVLQQMGKVVTSDPGTQHLQLSTRIRLMAVQGEWETLKGALPAAAAKLPDSDLQRLLRQVLPLTSGKPDVSDAICGQIIEAARDKPQSFAVAGRQWVDNAMTVDKAALPVRLDHLQQAGLPIRHICSLYMRYFYDVIDEVAIVKSMKQLGSRIAPLAEDDETRNYIRTMVLDASFVLEDYATAIDILESGIAGRDAAWHTMALSKVKAHKALKEERPRDAVKHFREFMATVATSKEEETSDPSTGIVHSREVILGRNAKRIGDILKGMQPPDTESANKAYAEAKDYYDKALAREQDPAAIEMIRSEMAGL